MHTVKLHDDFHVTVHIVNKQTFYTAVQKYYYINNRYLYKKKYRSFKF